MCFDLAFFVAFGFAAGIEFMLTFVFGFICCKMLELLRLDGSDVWIIGFATMGEVCCGT